MATRTLNVVISGDAKGITRAVKNTESQFDRLDKSGKKTLGSLKTGMVAVGAAAAGGLVIGLKKSAEAAIEAEKANARLQAQLKALGISYKDHEKQIQSVIDKQSQLAGLDDEDLGDSFTNIVRVTKDVNEALKLNGLAADIARAKNIDVAKAGQLVGKAYDGNVGALKRYGVNVDPVTKAQDKLRESQKNATAEQTKAAKESDKQATAQKALAEAQRVFGGQAEAYGKTTAGASDRAKVALENLGETIGAKVTPIIAAVAEWFNKLVRQITLGEGPGGRIRKVFEGLAAQTVVLFKAIRGLVQGFQQGRTGSVALVAAMSSLLAGFVAFKIIGTVVAAFKAMRIAVIGVNVAMRANPVGLVITALTALGVGLVIAYKRSETFRRIVDGAFNTVKNSAQAVYRVIKPALDGVVQSFRGLIQFIQGVFTGNWRKALTGIKNIAGGMAKGIGSVIVKGILAGMGQLGHQIRDKVIDAVKFAVNIGSSPVDIGKSIGNAIAKGVGIGDGPGKFLGGGFGGGNFTGGLDGARPALGPFAAIGSKFGLHVSDGKRPAGTRTSSGGISYHSSGEAIDLADGRGPDANKLGFFKYMKSHFGGRLAELIYTPGGAGIKDGRPFQYTGSVAADHYDHVHVALDTGAPGIGDGLGRRVFTGDGVGQLRSLWTSAGGRKNAADVAAAIAMAESGGDPSAHHTNSDGSSDRGLWQINSTHGALSTFNRMRNAKAAVSISNNGRNWQPWTTYTSGAYKKFLAGASGGGRTSGSSGPQLSRGGSVVGGAGNTAAGIGSTHVGGPNEPLLGPGQGGFEQQIADVDVRKGTAESKNNLGGLISALQDELRIKTRRIKKIRRALKRHLRKATRLRLTQELSSLLGDVKELRSTLKEYRADARGGATTISGAEELEAGVDPNAPEAPEAAEPATPVDYLNAAIANAALTPGTADDLAAAIAARDYYQGVYNAALATPDPRDDIDAAQNLAAAIEAVTNLQGAIEDAQQIEKEHTAALIALAGEMKQTRDYATGVQNTESNVLKRMLADLMSGQLAGPGVAARRLTPGYGVQWRF